MRATRATGEGTVRAVLSRLHSPSLWMAGPEGGGGSGELVHLSQLGPTADQLRAQGVHAGPPPLLKGLGQSDQPCLATLTIQGPGGWRAGVRPCPTPSTSEDGTA